MALNHTQASKEAVNYVFDENSENLTPPADLIPKAQVSKSVDIKSKSKKRAEATAEFSFVKHMETKLGDYRIGGLISEHEGYEKTLYRWMEGKSGNYWRSLSDEEIEAQALEFLSSEEFKASYSSRKASSCVDTLKSSWITNRRAYLAKHNEAVVIPCLDDYLAINKAGQLKRIPADKLWGATFCVKASLGLGSLKETEEEEYIPRPLPEGSVFKAFIEEIMPDEGVRNVLQEALGSTLLTKNYQKAIWLQGSGANGKSTLLSIIQAFHSKWTTFALEQLDNRFGLAGLIGASLVCVPETPKGTFNEEAFKKLVGRDVVSYESKGKDFRNFKPQAVWVLAMNKTPAIRDHTDGFWRRVLPIPFAVQIPESRRVADFEKRMIDSPEEMKAILDWLLVGAVRLYKRGSFLADKDMPKAIRDLLNAQKQGTDSVLSFLEDFPIKKKEEGGNLWSSKLSVYEEYQKFCVQSGKSPSNNSNFWERIREYVRREEGRDVEECQWRVQNGRQRFVDVVFDGIRSFHKSPF